MRRNRGFCVDTDCETGMDLFVYAKYILVYFAWNEEVKSIYTEKSE